MTKETDKKETDLKEIIDAIIENRDIFIEADNCLKGEKLYYEIYPDAKRENINKNNKKKLQNDKLSFCSYIENKTNNAITKRTVQRSLRIGKYIKDATIREEIKTNKNLYKRNILLNYISSFKLKGKQNKEKIEANKENLSAYLKANPHLTSGEKTKSKSKTISIDFEKCTIRENGKPHEFSKKELKELKTIIDDLIKTKTA